MLHSVDREAATDVARKSSGFIFRIKQSKKTTLPAFGTPTRCNIPENANHTLVLYIFQEESVFSLLESVLNY
jgi:hypothetical protein